jgi:hypothetical protein
LTRQTFGSVNVRAHLWPERRAMPGDEEMEDAFRSAVVVGFGDTPAEKVSTDRHPGNRGPEPRRAFSATRLSNASWQNAETTPSPMPADAPVTTTGAQVADASRLTLSSFH